MFILAKNSLKMKFIIIIFTFLSLFSCKKNNSKDVSKDVTKTLSITKTKADSLIFPEEKHFKSITQVTFGGDNAEAYWSFDDKHLVFQSNNKNWGLNCDQMFLMNLGDTFKNTKPKMISTGKGRTTCAYFLPGNNQFVYG